MKETDIKVRGPDLKPCPFCGSRAMMRRRIDLPIAAFYAVCSNSRCSCRSLAYLCKDEVARVWNRRAE